MVHTVVLKDAGNHSRLLDFVATICIFLTNYTIIISKY